MNQESLNRDVTRSRKGNALKRRGMLVAIMSAPLLTGCGLPRLFVLKIAEEVQLHDGTILLVDTEVQFQRTNIFSRYQNVLRRVTTLTFDAGPPSGVVKFVTWLRPVLLDRIEGRWYLVLSGQGPSGKTDESPHLWGHDFTTREQRLAILEGNVFRAAAWDLAPPSIRRENLFPLIEAVDLAKLDGKRVSVQDKDKLLQDLLLDPGRRQITRPQRMKSAD